MAGYVPMKIAGMTGGLVQEREEFILPNDAYPVLENAFVWRERIKRKLGTRFLGRLQRVFNLALGNFNFAAPPVFTANLYALAAVTPEANAVISPGSISITGAIVWTWTDENQDSILIITESAPAGYNDVILNVNPNGVNTDITIGLGFPTYNVGDRVYISGIAAGSTTELNGNYYNVVSNTPFVITINVDSSGFTPYVPGSGGRIRNANGSINYLTSDITLTANAGFVGAAVTGGFAYNPNLPVMGILLREIDSENRSETVFFDTKYAYKWVTDHFEEFIPGFAWQGADYQLFWGTNYWVSTTAVAATNNLKIFWVTNFKIDLNRDPIRYTNGLTWTDFSPQVNSGGTRLIQARCLLPFRGRFLAFNTLEGASLNDANAVQYRQRIRWSAIGTPFYEAVAGVVTQFDVDGWKDDIRGKGGFIDIPTNQDIISVGFVRDNLVIYCERSTWQLRYTGRSIQPFQVERVNSELGTESTFSSVQFDTSLVCFGDKGMTECDSFKSDRIDIKIPDLVFRTSYENNNNKRIYGVRDFQQRLAYWAYPYTEDYTPKFPNKRLVYNYENDSWAIFEDSFTCFGSFQTIEDRTWAQATYPWSEANFPWKANSALFPYIVAGNQQGFISILDQLCSSEQSLYIYGITGSVGSIVRINSPAHNLATDQIIQINNIQGDYSYLNGINYQIERIDDDNFDIYQFNSTTQKFDQPAVYQSGSYIQGGTISVRDNFIIRSKKFNFLDDGQNIQLGYIDILFENTEEGEISLNVYSDYNTFEAINTYPENAIDTTNQPDTFFNSVIPTYVENQRSSTKNWQRVFCPSRAAFLTTEFTLSDAQMNDVAQESDVQIDAQIMWIRKAGRQLPIGV